MERRRGGAWDGLGNRAGAPAAAARSRQTSVARTSPGKRGGASRQRGGGGDAADAEEAMLDPVVQRQIQRLVARQVARQVAKAVEVARADIQLKTDRKITEGLASMLRTVKSAAKQAPARETATAAANLSPVGRGRIDRSAHESEPALVALRQRTEQIENHVESYLRRHGQSSEELAQRVGAIERNLHDTPPRPAGPAAHPLDAEEFDVRLASVEARIEEVCHSQEQDTVHLRRQIAQVEEHGQALQVVSEPERHGLPRAQQPEHDDDLGQRQRQLEAHQRSYRDSMWRLEKRQAELESTMKRLLQNPAIATTLNGRPVPLHSSPPPESPTRDGQMSPRHWSGSDGSGWDMAMDGVGDGFVTPAEIQALELKVDEMRRDTDRCQELLKFCSSRLNLRSVRAIRVEDGSKRTRGDETTVCNSQWKMTLVPGVPMKRQVKSQRRWKTANWKPPHLVRAAKAAGILDLHGSVAKARATKLYQEVARARAEGAVALHGPTLRDMLTEAKAWGQQELQAINQDIHEAHEKSAAEEEVRAEMQATLRSTESRVEELERTLADVVEQSARTDKALRGLEASLDELSGWRERAGDMQRQIADVADRCHQTASVFADHQLGMKALEAVVHALPTQRAAAGGVQLRPAAARQYAPGADWLKDDEESEVDQRLRPLSPQKQRTSDHLSRLQKRIDEAIGSGDPSKVVKVLRDASAVEADDGVSELPDHTFAASLTALKNHAATLCDRGCDQMEALLGTAAHGPADAVGSSDPGLIEDELARWEDLANWNSRVGAVWSRLADYHDALTGQVEELRRSLRILAGRARQPQELANLEAALSESVVFQPELATDRKRLEAVVQALAADAATMLQDAKSIRQLEEIDDLLATFERVTNTRVRAAWQALRGHRDDVAETCSQLRALIEKTVGCGDDGRVSAVIKEAEPYAGELGQSWVTINQYHDSLRSEGTRQLHALLQIQPGDYGTDSEAAVVAKVDAALARFQHSTDPHVLELWSELCVHRAALREGVTGGSADAVHRSPLGPPLGNSALHGVERDEHRQQQVEAPEQRLVERRRQWAAVSPQESRATKSPLGQRPLVPSSERLLDSFRESRTEALSQPEMHSRGRVRRDGGSGGSGLRPSMRDDGDWSDSDLSDSGTHFRRGHSSPGRPERQPPRDLHGTRTGGAGVEADRAREKRFQRGPPMH